MRAFMAMALMALAATASAAEPAKVADKLEYPKPLTLNVQFPGDLNREAMVILEFDLPANGKPTNIRIGEGGFHEKRFTDEAIRALRNSRWQPRRINGAAVDTPGLRQSFQFSINAGPGITPEFRREADKVEKLLKSGDYKGGEFHAEWMLAEKVKLNYEYAVLEAELAFTYALVGKNWEAMRKAARATERSGTQDDGLIRLLDAPPPNRASNYMLPKDVVVQLLGLRMKLLAAQGLPLEAMWDYYELAGLGPLPPGDPLVALAERLTAAIKGNGVLRARIDMTGMSGWRQFISRRSFTIEKVQGEIHDLYLRCGDEAKQLDYAPGEEWTVPEGWSQCTVGVRAEPGTTYEFVELADAPAPAVSP